MNIQPNPTQMNRILEITNPSPLDEPSDHATLDATRSECDNWKKLAEELQKELSELRKGQQP